MGIDSSAFTASPEEAVVIFANIGREARRRYSYPIFDEDLRCVGTSQKNEYFAVRFSPGEHMLVTVVGNTAQGAKISVEGGKTYLVEVMSTYDGKSFAGSPFVAIPASTWKTGSEFLELFQPKTDGYVSDEAQCEADWKLTNPNIHQPVQAVLGQLKGSAAAPFLQPGDGGDWKGWPADVRRGTK